MKHQLVALALAIVILVIIGTRQTGKAMTPTPTPVSVPQFEYCQYFGNYYPDSLLNNMGHEGWELVSLNTIGEIQVQDRWQPKGFGLTFKRLVGSGLKSRSDSKK